MSKRNKNLIKFLVILLFVTVGAFEWLIYSINKSIKPEFFQQQALEAIKEKTGLDVKITGGIHFALLPTPRLVFTRLEVDSSSIRVTSIPNLVVEKVEIYIVPSSILSDHIQLSGIALVNPVLSLERAEDNTIHWEWLNAKLLKAFSSKNRDGSSLPLYIYDGKISYQDNINSKSLTMENITVSTAAGADLYMVGNMQSIGRSLDFIIDSNIYDLSVSGDEFPLNILVNDGDKNIVKLQSVVDLSGDIPKMFGNFNVDISDVREWVAVSSRVKDNNYKDDDKKNAMPINVKGEWVVENSIIQMREIELKGLNSAGKGTANVRWDNWYPTISSDLEFDYIDYFQFAKLLQTRIDSEDIDEDDEVLYSQNYRFIRENPLPSDIEMRFNVNTKKVVFGKQEWGETRFNAVLDAGSMTINQCDISLKGDGLLSIFGVVSQGGMGDLRFEGNMEAKGKKLHEAISMFYPSARDLPEIGTGDFYVSSNLYMNSQLVRLFEADIEVEDIPVSGTMTLFFEEVPRVETVIKLKNINFDNIRNKFLKEVSKNKEDTDNKLIKPDADIKQKKSVLSFDWLKNLSTRFDIGVYVENFTFMERNGKYASFSVYAYNGDLRFSNVNLVYPDSTTEINATLNVLGAIPYVGLMVNADQLDTSYFTLQKKYYGDFVKKSKTGAFIRTVPKENHSYTPVPVEWMDHINGAFDITLHKLIHNDITLDGIKLQARLENKKMEIQKLSFLYSQAQTDITGTVYGGKVPGLNAKFSMSNADIYELLNPLTGLKNISGFTSLSGAVTTAGWAFGEWVDNMDGKFLIYSNAVKVKGINIDAVTSVVNAAKSSADVFNNVNNVLTKGITDFIVDGSVNIKNGEMQAPQISIRSGLVTGTMVGKIKLESLTGQFSTILRFSNFSTDYPPILIVQVLGSLDNPEIKVDTASLEDYVSRINVGRSLTAN